MTARPDPPRAARRLLEIALPGDVRDEITGDLAEVFKERCASNGVGRARVWYWREAMLFSLRFTLERVSDLVTRQRTGWAAREGHGRRSAGISWLDFKLGFRMLVKYPGLTLVGGLAMAFAIWVGAGSFEFITQIVRPTLPLEDGDRVVGIQLWDASTGRVERQVVHELAGWRSLESIEDVGAFRLVGRNMTIEGRGAEPIEVAEISAAAFRMTRVAPLMGRALEEADEVAGAAPVVVIGHDVWQRRFGGDARVIGQQVRLGSTLSTVVGVMPDGFAFPIAQSVWTPLTLDALQYERREGPALSVFGRLAPGTTIESAQVELTSFGERVAADFPDTHEHLRPQVLPYARSIIDFSGFETLAIMSANVLLIMLLVLICSNIALLMFARAASRESEIIVRSALGASRGRIIVQLFSEALVLGGIAAVIGLAAAGYGLRWGLALVQGELLQGAAYFPFWFGASLSPATIVYAILLTVIGAAIAGVLPALKVTRGLQARLRAAAAGNSLRFGGVWTAVIVAQVAVTVAFPVAAYFVRKEAIELRTADVGIAEEQYLTARLEIDAASSDRPAATSADARTADIGSTYFELRRRLEAEPLVAGVTYANRLPRMYHPARTIVVDAGGAAPLDARWGGGYRVSSASVAPDYFDVLGSPVIAGRGFHSADLVAEPAPIIVNQSFVRDVLGGRNPIGRRIRHLGMEEWDEPVPPDSEQEPWYEIVGVVEDLGMSIGRDPKVAGFYHPATPDAAYPIQLAVHVNGDPESFVPRLRRIAAAVDPALRVYEPVPLDELSNVELQFLRFWFQLVLMVSAIALLLSLAGIYSVMAFTVSRRTREIGIRIALGSSSRHVVSAILSRSLVQVSVGIIAGAILVSCLGVTISGAPSIKGAAQIVAYSALMMGVCMTACIVPARRALRIQPTEAMRQE